MRRVSRVGLIVAIAIATAMAASSSRAQTPTPWSFAGGDLHDQGGVISPPSAQQLNPRTVGQLKVKWTFTTAGDVTATPTVETGGLYVPDWGGMLYKLDPLTGSTIWAHALSDYTGLAASFSRTSPAIGAQNEIVLGDQAQPALIAVDRTTGALRWQTLVDSSGVGKISSSPVIYNHRVYVGVASGEEYSALTPGYTPSFRGSVVALDESTGAILWRFATVPPGYTGGGLLGGPPVVDEPGKSLIVGTGNNYTIPASAQSCVAASGPAQADQLACLDPADYVDAVLSLDLKTGRLNWSRRMQGADTWTLNCNGGGNALCPTPAGGDDDFASGGNLMWVPNFAGAPDDRAGTSGNYILGIGQKSGMYWALNPANGGLFWSTRVGTSIQWGSAINVADHTTIFVPVANAQHIATQLAGRNGVPQTWNAGSWAAIQMTTGRPLWQIPAYGADIQTPGFGGDARARMTFANRLVFAGSTSGWMTAVDATSGNIRWAFNSGSTVESAPAFFNDWLYWGTGYRRHGIPGNTLFAFSFQ